MPPSKLRHPGRAQGALLHGCGSPDHFAVVGADPVGDRCVKVRRCLPANPGNTVAHRVRSCTGVVRLIISRLQELTLSATRMCVSADSQGRTASAVARKAWPCVFSVGCAGGGRNRFTAVWCGIGSDRFRAWAWRRTKSWLRAAWPLAGWAHRLPHHRGSACCSSRPIASCM